MTALHAKVDNSDSDSGSFKLFVRFSNLIVGPTFLPIHAEIMLWDCEREIEEMEKVEQNPGRTGGEMNFLHSFISLKPTEPSTILRLLSFQNVEGLARHRKLGVRVGSEENTYSSIQEEAFSPVSTHRIKALLSSNVQWKSAALFYH